MNRSRNNQNRSRKKQTYEADQLKNSNFERNVRNHSNCRSIIIETLITHKEDIQLQKDDNEIQYQRYSQINIVSKIYSSTVLHSAKSYTMKNKMTEALKGFNEKNACINF